MSGAVWQPTRRVLVHTQPPGIDAAHWRTVEMALGRALAEVGRLEEEVEHLRAEHARSAEKVILLESASSAAPAPARAPTSQPR